MKKLLALLMSLIMMLSMTACGNSETSEDSTDDTTVEGTDIEETEEDTPEVKFETIYNIGDTVETERMSFTLDKSELAMELINGMNDASLFATPKEYDPEIVTKNPFLAPLGRTLAFYEGTFVNKDRASISIGGTGDLYKTVFEVTYKDESYYEIFADDTSAQNYYTANKKNDEDWTARVLSNILIHAGDVQIQRGYMSIPVETDTLNDEYYLTVYLPDLQDQPVPFTFLVPAK